MTDRRVDDDDAARLRTLWATRQRRAGEDDTSGAERRSHGRAGAPKTEDERYLVDALRGPAPCDCCERATRCGSQQLACSSFSVYANGRPEKHWRAAPRTDATRERFAAVFGRESKRAA